MCWSLSYTVVMFCFVMSFSFLGFGRKVISWYRPFCVELQETTFVLLKSFLERFCANLDNEEPMHPFITIR